MVDSYLSIGGEEKSEYIISKSRFIGYAKHVETTEEAQSFVNEIKKKHFDARHNCYAYVLGENSGEKKFSDDGEPGGTAGMPILDAISKNNLTNTAVVVTRYFGGIKLGAGGLVRAYSKACSDVIKLCEITKSELANFYSASFDYTTYNKIEKTLKEFDLEIISVNYQSDVVVDIVSVVDLKDKIIDLCGGKTTIKFIKKEYYDFKIKGE